MIVVSPAPCQSERFPYQPATSIAIRSGNRGVGPAGQSVGCGIARGRPVAHAGVKGGPCCPASGTLLAILVTPGSDPLQGLLYCTSMNSPPTRTRPGTSMARCSTHAGHQRLPRQGPQVQQHVRAFGDVVGHQPAHAAAGDVQGPPCGSPPAVFALDRRRRGPRPGPLATPRAGIRAVRGA